MAPRTKVKRRKPVPTILQIEQTECGVACLAMIMASYGMHVGLERLQGKQSLEGCSQCGSRCQGLP
jgi:ABC-type bacteriocin/lantibiotic exporter with double-glycine peptidase domain